MLKKIGRVSSKKYKCTRCGALSMQSTNHYGDIYNLRCKGCSWKNPMNPFVTMRFAGKVPAGWGKPPAWKKVRLGDIMEFKKLKRKGF